MTDHHRCDWPVQRSIRHIDRRLCRGRPPVYVQPPRELTKDATFGIAALYSSFIVLNLYLRVSTGIDWSDGSSTRTDTRSDHMAT